MRILVEGVRLDPEEACKTGSLIAAKIRKLLDEAVVRTPPSITSRQFVEEAYRLAIALQTLLSECRIQDTRDTGV